MINVLGIMESLRRFHCKVKCNDLDDIIGHAYQQHVDEDFAIIVKERGRHIPKFYHWKPQNHNRNNVQTSTVTKCLKNLPDGAL